MEKRVARVSLKEVSLTFFEKSENTHVIDEISLDVYNNEFLVILGPGQCGKTSLLKLIAGLMPNTSGEVVFHYKEAKEFGNIGFIFQKYALFPWKTVIQNVEMALKIRGMKKKERRKKAQEYINMVGLQGFENSHPKQLSGGMKQRVGIARAFVTDSELILMDEPFGALDAQTRYQMQGELSRMWSDKKKTIIFVTNNIEEAIYLADRIILLSGAPSKVKAEYNIELPRSRSLTDHDFLELRNTIAKNTDLVL